MDDAVRERPTFLPQPRSLRMGAGRFRPAPGGTLVLRGAAQEMLADARRLQRALSRYGFGDWPLTAAAPSGRGATHAVVLTLACGGKPQGYTLRVKTGGVAIDAADAAGMAYGVSALVQLLRQSAAAQGVQECVIDDWPDYPVRGVLLDISRDKVPTLPTLFALVDELSEWRINHLELYTEHTFAYRRHPSVWRTASPMTGEDILLLDAYCRERQIELVPNQNSFGHLERWLQRPEYADLSECPAGFDYPWRHCPHPFSLNPTDPRSIALLGGLFDELLPHFTSRKFNVGCDETYDVGQGRSRAACDARGRGRVYLEFLLKIHEQVRRHGRTMHVWGDFILKHPEIIGELPEDVVVLEWGYEGDHPFAAHGELFARSGRRFYVCPGTSSWNSVAGRTQNCLDNILNAARNGLKHGAAGLLCTDWGDHGHWQYLPISYLGFAAAAGLAWCVKANAGADWPAVLDRHVFRDRARVMGRVAYDLGNAYRETGLEIANATALFHLLQKPVAHAVPRLAETRAYVEGCVARLRTASMDRTDGGQIQNEFAAAARMLMHACDRGMGVAPRRLAEQMRGIVAEHRWLWAARNRPGGLDESVRVLQQRLAEYESEALLCTKVTFVADGSRREGRTV